MTSDEKQFYEALGECYNALDDAYWAASSIEVKDNILGCIRHVSDMRDIMLLNKLEDRTAEFGKVAEKIAAGNKRLEKLKDQIDDLINKIDAITKVVATISKVISFKALIPGLGAI